MKTILKDLWRLMVGFGLYRTLIYVFISVLLAGTAAFATLSVIPLVQVVMDGGGAAKEHVRSTGWRGLANMEKVEQLVQRLKIAGQRPGRVGRGLA